MKIQVRGKREEGKLRKMEEKAVRRPSILKYWIKEDEAKENQKDKSMRQWEKKMRKEDRWEEIE